MTLHFIMLPAYPVFQARVNMPSVTWPVDELTFDGVFWGAYEDIRPGMLLRLGTEHDTDDRGRQRVRGDATATTIPVGRSSLGSADGELYVQDNLYISVFEDYRVWAKTPYIAPDGTMYKDSDIEVGTYTTNPPPVANTGPPAVGTIDSVTEQLQVLIPPVGNTSFATADGASITDYVWELPDGVTLADGYALTDDQILIDCDPGFHWIALTVTDSNGETHTARTFVYAYDPAAKLGEIEAFEVVSHRITRAGQTLSVRILEDAPRDLYLDGTLVLLWDGEPNNLTDRSNMLFWGWLQTEPTDIQASRTATLAGTVLECVDVAGRLDTLPGFSQVIYNDAKRDTDANPDITWAYMVDPTWDKLLHYLLHWHSTALELADWSWSDTGTDYQFTVREAGGASLFEQVDRQAQSMCPDRYLTCNRLGQLAIQPDPLLQNVGDRTSDVQMTIAVDDWSQIQYAYQRPPRVHWLDESAVLSHPTEVHALFCHAPGDAPGQGEGFQTHGEQIAPSQDVLNQTAGHRYARLNARQGMYQITLAGSRMTTIDPALMSWVRLNISSDVAAQRGMALTNARGLVHEMTVRYDHARTGLTRQVDLLWERETDGYPAVTVIPPEILPVGEQPTPEPAFDFGLTSDQEVVAGIEQYYIYRTSDFQTPASSGGPTWQRIDMTRTLANTDPYVMVENWVVDPFSPGYVGSGTEINGWAVTQKYIFRLTDIFGALGVNAVHTFPTVMTDPQGSRTINASFGRYFETGNPWLAVVSYYDNTSGHTGTWVTYSVNGGATWSDEVQINPHYGTSISDGYARIPALYLSPKTPGFAIATAWLSTAAQPLGGAFYTTDWGASWSALSEPDIQPYHALAGDLHVPWPNNDDEHYAYYGYFDSAAAIGEKFGLRRVDGTTIVDISPTDGGRVFGVNRPGFKVRTYDSDRKYVAVGGYSGDGYAGVWVSDDYGATWTNILTPHATTAPGFVSAAFSGSDPNILYVWGDYVDTAHPIYYTNNFGTTLDSRKGNLETLIDGDIGPGVFVGICGGPAT